MSNLGELITLHRAMFRDELDFSPSQRTPPVAYTYDSSERAMVPDSRPLVYFDDSGAMHEIPDSATQSTQIGMPMSSRMLRYLQGPAPDTPWAMALKRLRAYCRRDHAHHRGATEPYWRGSLCWQLVFITVVGKPKGNGPATVEEAARILRYDNPEPVLREALRYIEDAIDRERVKQEKRKRDDEGRGPGAVPEPVRPCYHDDCKGRPHYEAKPHPDHEWHRVDCPKCRRNAA